MLHSNISRFKYSNPAISALNRSCAKAQHLRLSNAVLALSLGTRAVIQPSTAGLAPQDAFRRVGQLDFSSWAQISEKLDIQELAMPSSVQVVCPHCHTTNRVPQERLGDGAICGRCKASLFAGHVVELDQASFEKHLKNSDLPLVVDFCAPGCGPCRQMAPHFAQAAARLEPQYRLAKVNTRRVRGGAGVCGRGQDRFVCGYGAG